MLVAQLGLRVFQFLLHLAQLGPEFFPLVGSDGRGGRHGTGAAAGARFRRARIRGPGWHLGDLLLKIKNLGPAIVHAMDNEGGFPAWVVVVDALKSRVTILEIGQRAAEIALALELVGVVDLEIDLEILGLVRSRTVLSPYRRGRGRGD